MNAVISGRVGTALLIDGDSLLSFDVDDPDILVHRKQSDLPFLFGDTTDLQFFDSVDRHQAREYLDIAYNSACALDLTLILFDPELSAGVREDAAKELEELLRDELVAERVEYVMYSRPLPSSADIAGAKKHCAGQTTVSAWLRQLLERQPLILEIHRAWDAIPETEFGETDKKTDFQRVIIRHGLFRNLALAYENGNADSFLITALMNSSVREMQNHRSVLQQWAAGFRTRKPSISAQEIKKESETEASEKRGRKKGHKSFDRLKVFENVVSQKQAIVECMRRRDLNRFWDLLNELIEYQKITGNPKLVVKSLCDLAMEAKELGNHPLQLQLTEQSISIQPDDAWSWAQHADALLNMQRLTEALNAYEQADAFGAGAIAKTGRAEVLKALGKLNDALEAYDAVIAEYPGDVFAKTGRAEVLKALGRFDESLRSYDAVIVEHPENVIAKNGRAEVLKALGKLNDALEAYDVVIAEHPENVFAKTGRAEVLKALGKFNDALVAYDVTISQHPESSVAKRGRAEVLKALGKFNDALEAYNAVIAEHPENVIAKTGRAEVLKALGRLYESLAAYDAVIVEHPEDAMTRNGRSCVLLALHRYDEALANLPDSDLSSLQDWIGYHIRGMILLRASRIDDALKVFEIGVISNPWHSSRENFRTALGITWMRQHNFSKASQTFDEVTTPILQTQVDILRIHSYGEMEQFDLAAQAYERVSKSREPSSEKLIEELNRRYIRREDAHHDDEWVFDQEINFILAANQNLTHKWVLDQEINFLVAANQNLTYSSLSSPY